MQAARSLALFCALLAVTAAFSPARVKRQLVDDDKLQPLEVESEADEQTRDKRKFEGVTQAKFGIKNAILGFVFGTGTTSHHREDTNIIRPLRSITGKYQVTDTIARSREGSSMRLPRQAPTTPDGVPVFDRNKVSLDFPGNLFGPSVSLLIKTTKIVGDVIQNSAVRYQTFLRLFRPLFRGPFEIKGLDPPTTTTTTTTKKPPATADNEVRRRRQA